MKLAVVALDYDGTIATDGVMDAEVRDAIAQLRLHGIAVLLVTGRRFAELQKLERNLECFSAVVAENGAVLYFPESQRYAMIGLAPPPAFLYALRERGIPFAVGDSVVETDAANADVVLQLVRALELPLMLAFNRGRLMVLPPGIAKSSGLRRALSTLRLSIHNAIGIGDAENDYDLLDACEVGVAVEWGSQALRAIADEVIAGTGPAAVAGYLRRLAGQVRLSAEQMGRRRLLVGHHHDGMPLRIAVRGRSVIIAGEPGSGKSWLAGLHCEQLILQGYCLCIIDPEGDYLSLESLPGVVVMGGDDPPPRIREIAQALRYPDVSLVIDLSKLSHPQKQEYLRELLPSLAAMRRASGLPHKILIDEAHYYLGGPEGRRLVDAELAGYIFVTYRVSGIDEAIRDAAETLVMVTRETDPQELQTLLQMATADGSLVAGHVLQDLQLGEAALLPGADEARGQVLRFRIGRRLTLHVRHRSKYVDMPISEAQAFVFLRQGAAAERARSLNEFVMLLDRLPDDEVVPYLERHDFSRWLADVYRDCPLATHVRRIESRVGTERPRDVVSEVARAIRARYDMAIPAAQ